MLLAVLALCACTAAPKDSKSPARRSPASSAEETLNPSLEPVNVWALRFVGMDDDVVPPFRLHTTRKRPLDSASLVGRRAFAIVFFATWCDVCDLKLHALKTALATHSDFTVIGVAVDDVSTWRNVPSYVRDHGFSFPVVAALEHPAFTLSYNPFSTVPLVVIVGRNGGLVDYQLGYQSDDVERLTASLELAKTIGPLAKPRHKQATN